MLDVLLDRDISKDKEIKFLYLSPSSFPPYLDYNNIQNNINKDSNNFSILVFLFSLSLD